MQQLKQQKCNLILTEIILFLTKGSLNSTLKRNSILRIPIQISQQLRDKLQDILDLMKTDPQSSQWSPLGIDTMTFR